MLLFNNTDSQIYEIKIEDFYEDFSKYIEMFDVRNYSAIKNFMMIANKLLVNKMKDEADGVTVEKFV